MKTSAPSTLEHAHLIIMALTLALVCFGSVATSKQIAKDPSYAWFGYAPASIQPVMTLEHQIPMPQSDMHADSGAVQIL
jgi:hypothetical protein